MNVEIKKQFLNQYRVNELKIVRLKEELEKWENKATKGNQIYSDIPTQKTTDDTIQIAVENIININKV